MRACMMFRKVAAELQNDRWCKQEESRSMGERWRLLSSCGECLGATTPMCFLGWACEDFKATTQGREA
jgi:hypothetical protein